MPTPVLQDISLAQSQQQPLAKPTHTRHMTRLPILCLTKTGPEEYDESALYN